MILEKAGGQILIECPNTIFHLYIKSEQDLSKIETFMNNIRTIERLGLNDIYTWCNRQGILYDTAFNYHKETSFWKNIKAYVREESFIPDFGSGEGVLAPAKKE